MSTRTRLEKLEAQLGGGACPACGERAEGTADGDVRFTVITAPPEVPEPDPVPCGVCGSKPVRFTLNIGRPGETREDE